MCAGSVQALITRARACAQVALKSLGIDLSLADCTRLIASADKDGNGVVDYGEFASICRAKTD